MSDPPAVWAGALPPIGGQVNVEFIETKGLGTTATATNLWLATLTFEVLPTGQFVSNGEWGFGHGGNAFIVDGVDVADTEAFAIGSAWIQVIPEPTTALLLGLGLGGLGWRAARARR